MTDSQHPLRFGLIGVDSSHSVQFTRLLGDGRTGRVAGATVSSAFQAPTSADFPPSRDRNDALAAEVEGLGVQLQSSPEAVADASDALLIVASDVRTHRDHFTRVAPFGKPVYVDTRFARGPDDARAMLQLAAENGCLVLGGSPKRFTPQFASALGGGVDGVILTGPVPTQPAHEGLRWYGVHLVDLAVAALGPGCARVEPVDGRLLLHWHDGRVADIGGPAEWNPYTRGVVRAGGVARGFTIEADESMLAGLLRSIVAACRTGLPNIPAAHLLEITAIVEAGTAAMGTRSVVHLP